MTVCRSWRPKSTEPGLLIWIAFLQQWCRFSRIQQQEGRRDQQQLQAQTQPPSLLLKCASVLPSVSAPRWQRRSRPSSSCRRKRNSQQQLPLLPQGDQACSTTEQQALASADQS